MNVIPEAIILDPFYVIFYRLLPQLRFNLYKIFTSDVIQNNTSHVMWFLMQCKNSWKSSQKMIFRLILRRFRVTPPQALHSSHTTVLSKGIIFPKKRKKNADFFQKHAGISKIKRVLVLKVYFLKLRMCVHTHTQTHTHKITIPKMPIQFKDQGQRSHKDTQSW